MDNAEEVKGDIYTIDSKTKKDFKHHHSGITISVETIITDLNPKITKQKGKGKKQIPDVV